MAKLFRETITDVHHWNDTLFSFKCTRDRAFRFESGEFAMIGLEAAGRPILRPYSMASAYYDDHLEFLSIKVPGGELTSHLQHVEVGDSLLVNSKTTGTLLAEDLDAGRNLYLLSTGTGLAPFLSVIQDRELYNRFEKVVLVHGVRHVEDLAYRDWIESDLPEHFYVGEVVPEQLAYYPTVTREPFHHRGRITDLLRHDALSSDLGLPRPDPAHDRFMICGSPHMTADTTAILDDMGFVEARGGRRGHYTIERAFVEKNEPREDVACHQPRCFGTPQYGA